MISERTVHCFAHRMINLGKRGDIYLPHHWIFVKGINSLIFSGGLDAILPSNCCCYALQYLSATAKIFGSKMMSCGL
jgi:hypothetical protein